MNAAASIQDSVTRAQVSVRSALRDWDAANLRQCELCCETLRAALADLETARRAAERHGVMNCGAVQRQLEGVRTDTRVLMRLVDASTAFGRGLALQVAGSASAAEADARAVMALRTEVQA